MTMRSASAFQLRVRCASVRAPAPIESVRPSSSSPTSDSSRRDLLVFASLLLSTVPLTAQANNKPSSVCVALENAEDDKECRKKQLEIFKGEQQSYESISENKYGVVTGVPVSELGDAYSMDTLDLGTKIESYFTIDPYSKERVILIKTIKTDSSSWVSKYARGGSARTQSARKFYSAVDSVLGHLTSNGLAPFPARKRAVVQKNIDDARIFLAERR